MADHTADQRDVANLQQRHEKHSSDAPLCTSTQLYRLQICNRRCCIHEVCDNVRDGLCVCDADADELRPALFVLDATISSGGEWPVQTKVLSVRQEEVEDRCEHYCTLHGAEVSACSYHRGGNNLPIRPIYKSWRSQAQVSMRIWTASPPTCCTR